MIVVSHFLALNSSHQQSDWCFPYSVSSGVICLFQLNEMLCASLSNLMSPLSSLLTFIVFSLFDVLKEHGLQLHFIPLGFISIVFCNLSFPWHKGQSKVINLLFSFCSSSSFIIVGSSSDRSKSSGMGVFFIFFFAEASIYFIVDIIIDNMIDA